MTGLFRHLRAFVFPARPGDVRDLSWTVQEVMNVVISGGIIGPAEIP